MRSLMSREGESRSGEIEAKVVMALNAVVDEVAADILDRNYDAAKIAAARNSGQYVTLFEAVRLQVGRELYTRGNLTTDELAQTVRAVVEPWREEIRHTTEMRAVTPSDPDEYEIEYWRKDTPHDRKLKREIPADKTSITLDNLEPGIWVTRIRGWNKAGPGPWSDAEEVEVKHAN